ncbi:MAG: N-ethylammeline chlorohydrolase, partial [Deltaproteobacteria bacterium]
MAEGDVPTRADVLVVDGRIAGVEASIDPPGSVEVVDVSGCFVLPGGIQAHTHLGQALFRGLAEDRELLRWLRERIWPLEAAHDEESAYVSAALCLVDALASGTTTIQDMGLSFHTEALARACEGLGVRALLGPCLMDTGYDGLARTTDDALTAAESFAARPGRTWVRPILCP